ncbi:nucleoprotein TPR-like [Chenopodium quinoa]|uniref:nucleoprotein TPR-like n=1 Tax=Chenopodium quinoa TaxID=63459 RepID=UPI000B791277|nr:nucleoprotein TPR-like [Chenopodium quinoa]
MDSPIFEAISTLKLPLSSYDYDRTKRALSFVESRLKSEKDKLTQKFKNALMENNILTKQLEQFKKDHGELLLANSESQHQLSESLTECARIRMRLAAEEQEVQRLKNEDVGKIRGFSNEVKMLKKQNKELSDENGCLEERKMKIEEEFRICRLESEKLKGRIRFLEKEMKGMEKKVKEAEKEREEKLKLSVKNTKLERDLGSVMAAATERFRAFEKRVSDLERAVVILNDAGSGSGSDSGSGSQLVDTTEVVQAQESFGLEAKCEGLAGGLSGHETTPIEEKTASSMPSPKEISATRVEGQPNSFESNTKPGGPVEIWSVSDEKSASSRPCAHQSPSTSTHVVDLCSSDDDGELPSPKGLKRKLSTSEDPLGIRTHMESISPSKKTMAALKPCEQQVGVSLDEKYQGLVTDVHGESGSSNKIWDHEADLLDDLQKNTVLCMEGLCALYRQKMLYALRATNLAKFLTDAQGGLIKTLTDLEKFDPKGADDCKKIALAHSKQLFDIYKNGKDPCFAPAIISSQKTIV